MSVRRRDGYRAYVAAIDAFKVTADEDARGIYWRVAALTLWARNIMTEAEFEAGWWVDGMPCFASRDEAYAYIDDLEREAAKWTE